MKHFDESEFECACRCGGGFRDMDPDFVADLDDARTAAGVPFRLTSAYRCREHNQDIGGIADSSHCRGLAVDIAAASSHYRFQIVSALLKTGFNRIGVGKDFIHVDADHDKPPFVMWDYR